MENTYFVGFLQGTSGRFISSIMWSLLNDLNVHIPYSEFNSAHLESYAVMNWVTTHLPDPTWDKDCYQLIEFDNTVTNLNPNNVHLFYAHVYPDFETIFFRFSDAKVVVIKMDASDYMEIAGNYLFKNGIENTCHKNVIPHKIKFYYRMLYNKECEDTHNFTLNEIYDLVHLHQKKMLTIPYGIEYTETIVPEKFRENVLLLKYSDIYRKDSNGNYIGYELLKQFTNCIGNETIEENYKNYVVGRDKFISKHLPWIKNENYRTNTDAALVS